MHKPAFISKALACFVALSLIFGLVPAQQAAGQGASVQSPYIGMWISAQELASLPTSGSAWNTLLSVARANPGTPDIKNQDSDNDVFVLAKALVYARTGDAKLRAEVVDQLKRAMNTEAGGRTLALGRNLVSYVIAADLVNLPADSAVDQAFRAWLRKTLTEKLDGRTLVSTHEDRPNNWGTHAGASRVAVAIYLNDRDELDRAATVFRGYLGDRAVYSGFSYGDLSWQCNSSQPVGVNPKGCTKNGHNIDGALPEEMRRGGTFQWPPAETGYAWEGMQGVIVQAMLLHRAGYNVFEWQDRAILRAYEFLYRIGWTPTGDDKYQVWLINYAYGTNYPTSSAGKGKNMGWTDWTHARKSTSGSSPAPQPTATKPPVIAPTSQPTTAPTSVPNQPPTAVPTTVPTKAPTVAPTAAQPNPQPDGGNWSRMISFENGKLQDSQTGVDRVKGNVVLTKNSAMSGNYYVTIPGATDSYLQADFSGKSEIAVSFLLRVNKLPSSDSRIALFSNDGETIGNIVLRKNGSLRLRVGSTAIGADSAPLAVNTTYIVGLRQQQGSGSNGVLAAYVAPVNESLSQPFAWTNSGTWTTKTTFFRFGGTAAGALDAHFDNILLTGK